MQDQQKVNPKTQWAGKLHNSPLLHTYARMDDLEIEAPAETAEAPRRRGRLHGEAARRLREMIVAGEMPHGTRLREVQICNQLGVTRTQVLEAFRTLAAEGMVELLPNRSVVVAKLHLPDVGDLYEVVS